MTNKISIPKPCHEDWNNMSPEAQGRHCMACSKTVIDFTNWNEHQIRNYLESRSSEKVCGRFNTSQLEPVQESENIFPIILKSNISLLKKIAAIVLLCFGVASSQSYAQEIKGKVKCETNLSAKEPILMGDTIIVTNDSLNQQPSTIDSTKYEPQIMGMVKPYQPPKKTKMPKKPIPKK